jgi:hypothetical protein
MERRRTSASMRNTNKTYNRLVASRHCSVRWSGHCEPSAKFLATAQNPLDSALKHWRSWGCGAATDVVCACDTIAGFAKSPFTPNPPRTSESHEFHLK